MVVNRVTGGAAAQMYTPNGVDWYKMMIARKYQGDIGTEPVGVPDEGNGSFWFNNNGVVQGAASSQYIIFGWYYAGGAYREMRTLTGT